MQFSRGINFLLVIISLGTFLIFTVFQIIGEMLDELFSYYRLNRHTWTDSFHKILASVQLRDEQQFK